MKSIQIDILNPKFRSLVDQLLFTDINEIDLTTFKDLLTTDKVSYNNNLMYFEDRFKKACYIFWEDALKFWEQKLSFISLVEDKRLYNIIEKSILKSFQSLIRSSKPLDENHELAFIHFIALCNVKKNNKSYIANIKNLLIKIIPYSSYDKLIAIVKQLTPSIFNNGINDLIKLIINSIDSGRVIDMLLILDKNNISYEKEPLVKLIENILFKPSKKKILQKKRTNERIVLNLLNNTSILEEVRKIYTKEFRAKLLKFISGCEHYTLSRPHWIHIKNLTLLDSTLANDVGIIYVTKLYNWHTSKHNKANADKIIKLLRTCKEITPKKILAYLSSQNKTKDIKYIMEVFPDLKKFSAFI